MLKLAPSKWVGIDWRGDSEGYALLPKRRILNVRAPARSLTLATPESANWRAILQALDKDGTAARLRLKLEWPRDWNRRGTRLAGPVGSHRKGGFMREQFVSAFAIGLIAVAVAVGAILYMQRGAHMELTGPMTVRTVATEEQTALALINLHITNPSSLRFEAHNVTVTLETKSGEFPDETVSRVDSQRMFDSMPENGSVPSPALHQRDDSGAQHVRLYGDGAI